MNKNEALCIELEKIAASLQARNNKNYWGILKRLHGGTERTMDMLGTDNLKKYILHGTDSSSARSIMKEGLKPGHNGAWGPGSYFGESRTAIGYVDDSWPGIVRLKTPKEATKDNMLLPRKTKFKVIDDVPKEWHHISINAPNGKSAGSLSREEVLKRTQTNRGTQEAFKQYGKVDGNYLRNSGIHINETLPPGILKTPDDQYKMRDELIDAVRRDKSAW